MKNGFAEISYTFSVEKIIYIIITYRYLILQNWLIDFKKSLYNIVDYIFKSRLAF